jgi:uncharacterized SAM-binding protein YcdF (DUF218 family)
VPKSALRVELCSLTTEENALYCHQFARESWDLLRAPDRLSVVLVSCDWHMRRARGHFERQGFDCIPYPAQSPRSARSGLRWALERTRVAIDTALAKSELNL